MACGICKARGHNKRRCPEHPDYDPATGRVPPSEKVVRAARANGARGGAPIQHDVFEVFAGWPKPPKDPLGRAEWFQNIIAELAWLQIQGRGDDRVNDQVRRLAHASAELTPKERLWIAEQLIRSDGLKKKPKSNKAQTQPAVRGSKPIR